MIDYTNAVIKKIAIHRVGSKADNEELFLTDAEINIPNDKMHTQLLKLFLSSLANSEVYSFDGATQQFSTNAVAGFVNDTFLKEKNLLANSKRLAKHLYMLTDAYAIKSGFLFVVLFSNLLIDGEQSEAQGIFKLDANSDLLLVDEQEHNINLKNALGIVADKLDKGCLIINTEQETGYRICISDKHTKANEAAYWREVYLQASPINNNYSQTQHFLNITQNYVTNKLTEDFEVNKADQVDLMNRSVAYFKTHDVFKQTDFEQEVLQDSGVINSFRNFDNNFRQEHDLPAMPEFEISATAVKKQAKVFKSVVKLDKNFHIYIHGNRELIENGVDENGRKFYKIYYNNEN